MTKDNHMPFPFKRKPEHIQFPMDVNYEKPGETVYYDSHNNLKLHTLDYPRGDFRGRCVEMMLSTWADIPVQTLLLKTEFVYRKFREILEMKVLPNSLEHLRFQFKIEGLTLIEVTHLLRHRSLQSIHAQCSADRFLQDDSVFIPSSIKNSAFADEYKKVTEEAKDLYWKMIKSGKVSLLDSRYILTRNHRYFYYFGCDLKTAIGFIHQRKCTQVQPEMDNVLAHLMHNSIATIIPEIRDVVSLNCDSRCFYVKSESEDSSRVYMPDKVHEELIRTRYGDDSVRLEPEYYLHNKKRSEMGVAFNPQDISTEPL